MKKLEIEEARGINGGARRYYCPWNDYSNSSYWRTYGHAIACAAKRGLFDFPIRLIMMALN